MNALSRWLLLVCVLAIGCNSKTATTTAGNSEDGTAADSGSSKPTKIIPIKRDMKEVVGNWVVIFTVQQSDNYRWIVNFSKGADGKTTASFVDTRAQPNETDKPEINDVDVHDDSVRFVIKAGEAKLDFEGKFENGFVRGTTTMNPVELVFTRLLPTDETSLEKFLATGYPPGWDVLQTKLKSKDPKPEEFLGIANEFRSSPVAQDIYNMLLTRFTQQRPDDATIKETLDGFMKSAAIWGKRYEARSEMNVGTFLVNSRIDPKQGIVHLDAAEKKLGDDISTLKPVIDAYRDAGRTSLLIADLTGASASEEAKTNAFNELSELVKKQPYNAEILYALAERALKTGDKDKGIEYLIDVCSLPLLEAYIIQKRAGQPPETPLPSDELKKLWVEKHGNDEGLIAQLKANYRQKIDAYLTEIQQKSAVPPAGEPGNHTVLIEFFTGMLSPQAVATELALTAIQRSVPTSQAIIIRYHQHLPPPDGMANQDGEERGAFYEVTATPSVVFDGMKMDGRYYSGVMQATPQTYGILRNETNRRITEKSDITLKLSADLKDGKLSVSASATGIPEALLPSCRLRMALVENQIDTFLPLASNGIQDHELVVREMLGGSNGVVPKNGELKYSTSFPVEDLQKHATDYQNRFEAGRRLNQWPAEMKPPVRGPFSLVAWVQNDRMEQAVPYRLVLQAAIVPVTSDLPAAEATPAPPATTTETKPQEPAAPATTEKPTEEKPAAEKPTAEKPAAEAPATEKPAEEKPASEKPANDAGKAADEAPPAPALPE